MPTKSKVIIIILNLFCLVSSQNFIKTDNNFKGADGGSASWCDYNNDGLLDIFITGYNITGNDFTHAVFYKQTNENNFIESNISNITRVIYSQQAMGDFDNDGDIDIVLCGTTSGFNEDNITQLYRNEIDSFVKTDYNFGRIRGGDIEWVDYDNDGDLDLFLMGTDSAGNFKRILYRNDDGLFTDSKISFSPKNDVSSKWAKWADFNNDGYFDLLINQKSMDRNSISLYYNMGGGNFLLANTIGIPFDDYREAAVGDYNNDGLVDILLWVYRNYTPAEMPVILYKNTGKGVFQEIWRHNIEHFDGSLNLVDMNYDGLSDIFVYCQNNSNTLCFTNNGNSSFTSYSIPNLPKTLWRGKTFLADYNSDNKLDLLSIGTTTGSASDAFTYLYKNIDTNYNSKPTPPDSIYYQIDETGLIIKWTDGHDAKTTTLGLTYNVCLSTKPDSCNVIPCNSNLNGSRQIINSGNTRNNFYRLNKIPEGKYYCKVQTIDNSFASSDFSKTFEIDVQYTSVEVNIVNNTKISISPNPSHNYFKIYFDKLFTHKKISIYNIGGTKLFETDVSIDKLEKQLNISNYPNGLYFIKINVNSITQTIKLIKY